MRKKTKETIAVFLALALATLFLTTPAGAVIEFDGDSCVMEEEASSGNAILWLVFLFIVIIVAIVVFFLAKKHYAVG